MKWYPAPGKLNLFLHVLGKRETGEHAGYHELQTVFRLVDRADRVGIGLREDGEIRFPGVYGDDNLCVRAARLLQHAQVAPPWQTLEAFLSRNANEAIPWVLFLVCLYMAGDGASALPKTP